jgi:DNA-binding CsgD family transcriptional regulator
MFNGGQRAALHDLSARAAAAGVGFVELKCLLFGAILAGAEDDPAAAVGLLEECLPRQLRFGHIHLIAQELGPRPELASLILRRHRSNGLGPALVEALSRYWRFPEAAKTLRQLCPSQVGTWIDHVSAGHGRTVLDSSERVRRPGPASLSHAAGGKPALDELTPREREVLELMAVDRSNEEIAADLFVAIPTVKTHINHIRRKLGQTTRVGAVLEYQRLRGTGQR